MNLATIVERHPDDAVALISRGKPTTYGALRSQVAGLRAGLTGLGIAPGDRIGIACGNNRYFVVAYLASIGVGAIAVPLNPNSPLEEIESEINAVEAKAIVAGPTVRPTIERLELDRVPSIETVIGCGFVPSEAGVAIEELIAAGAEADPVPIRDMTEADVAVLIFTSGTAGSPKAAMLTHGNLRANLAQVLSSSGNEQTADDTLFGVLPMFHIFGLNVVLGVGLAVGAKVLLVERFDPVSAIESIAIHNVTVVTGPPTMWAAWANLPELPENSLASVRRAVSGAARLNEFTAQQVEQRFGLNLREGYGLTEAAPVVTTSVGTTAPFGSVGIPVPGLEVRIVDGEGDDVPIGDSGELWVRGPNVFVGYWRDPVASAGAVNEDGWLMTGDIATVDDQGFIYLVDRVKDLIIVSGFNVYPAEVEEVLMQHPAIEACAVVGVPHPYSGEAVKAYVVAEKGKSVEEDDIIRFCATKLARYKCPEKIWFVDEVPQGLGGKVLRRALR